MPIGGATGRNVEIGGADEIVPRRYGVRTE
jgi:hypothetical protein